MLAQVSRRTDFHTDPPATNPVSPVSVAPTRPASLSVALVSAHFPGVTQANRHLVAACGVKAFVGVDAFLASKTEVEWLILGGWSDSYRRLMDANRWKIALHWHSNLSQMDADGGGDYRSFREVAALLKAKRVQRILFTARPDAQVLSRSLGPSIGWLPDCYDFALVDGAGVVPVPKQRMPSLVPVYMSRIGRKQPLALFAALRDIEAELLLPHAWHDTPWASWIDLLGLRYRYLDLPWPYENPHVYYSALAACPFGAHIAFAETFCYQVADLWAMKIPAVLGASVPLSTELHGYGKERLVLADNTDPAALADRLRWLKDNRSACEDLGEHCRWALERCARRHQEAALETLEGLR